MSKLKHYGETVPNNPLFIKNVKYTLNGNTVTCIIKAEVRYQFQDMLNQLTTKPTSVNTTFVGMAKCSPNDDYNEITGRDIAEHKAMRKYYLTAKMIYTKLMNHYIEMSKAAFEGYEWAIDKAANQSNLMNRLID